MIDNLTLTIKGALGSFGGLPIEGTKVTTITGLYMAVRMLVALIVIILIPVMLIKAIKHNDFAFQYIAIFTISILLITIAIMLTTNLAHAGQGIQSARYLIPGFFMGLLVLLMLPLNIAKEPLKFVAVILIFLVLATSAYSTYKLSIQYLGVHWGMHGQLNPNKQQLIDFLKENNLKYGYASYWNGPVLSVLSQGKILVRQTNINRKNYKGVPLPMRGHSSNRWYRPSAWKGETFLLLTEKEARKVDWEALKNLGLYAYKTLTFNEYKIFVFAENISKKIPGWDSRYEVLTSFPVTKNSYTRVGKFIKKNNNQPDMLVAEKGERGFLYHGPYINVEPGKYIAIFDVIADHNDSVAFILDIVSSSDQKLYGKKLFKSSDKTQKIEFSISRAKIMEFRVFASGNSRVIFKNLSIQRLN